jgi:hypothetical protein
MKRALHVHVTFDADQDDSTGLSPERALPTWEGLALIERIDGVLSRHGIRYTLFVRADEQIRQLYGTALAVYDRHRSLFEGLIARGHEIGWHPHLYQRGRDSSGRECYLPLRDEGDASGQIVDTHEQIRRAGFQFESARIGEAWHATGVMCALDALGVRVDSTAIPGRARNDEVLTFDWGPTPQQPYHPSRTDYRIAGDPSSSGALSILEVPMTTVPIRASHDRQPLARYLNLAFHPQLFREGLLGFFREVESEDEASRGGPVSLTMVFHTGELLPRKPTALCSHAFPDFEANVSELVRRAEGSGLEVRYLPLREAARP